MTRKTDGNQRALWTPPRLVALTAAADSAGGKYFGRDEDWKTTSPMGLIYGYGS